MNYYEIGQRIRKYRKASGLSQETLAEAIEISTTHMSHIETGNTKLSLPVLVAIADILSVQTDALLYDAPIENKTCLITEMNEFLESCSPVELRFMLELMKSTKVSLKKYYES